MKFDFPMYNGELNAEKLDHWIKQIKYIAGFKKLWMNKQKLDSYSSDWEAQH
jgi:hypothetical protein